MVMVSVECVFKLLDIKLDWEDVLDVVELFDLWKYVFVVFLLYVVLVFGVYVEFCNVIFVYEVGCLVLYEVLFMVELG